MSNPFTLRILRPYASREEYLEGDCWTVERSEMLLLGAEGVAVGAQVMFEIELENKEIVVRGEGRALEIVPPSDGKPGGVRLRFKQLDAGSKATLRKALETRKKQAAAAKRAASKAPPPPAAAPEPEAPKGPAAPEPDASKAAAAAPEPKAKRASSKAPPPAATPEPEPPGGAEARRIPVISTVEGEDTEGERKSGVHERIAGPVVAPDNRDELLNRLRERLTLRKGALPVEKNTAAAE